MSLIAVQLLLGIVVSPFPAMRHMVPVLVPLTLVGLRYWQNRGPLDPM